MTFVTIRKSSSVQDKGLSSSFSDGNGSGRFLFFANIDLDLELEEAWRGGMEVPLHAVEFRLLRELMRAGGQMVGFDTLRARVWFDSPIKDRAIQDWVTELRQKLRLVGPDIVHSEPGRCGLIAVDHHGIDGDDKAERKQLKVGDLMLDRSAMRAHRGIKRIELSLAQFRLLEFLMLHPGQYFSATEISARIFPDEPKDQFATAAIMSRLRKAVRIAGRIDPICVQRGQGYGIFPR